MLQEPVVVIFRERNDATVCCIPLAQYPTGKEPAVGDSIPLLATCTYKARVGSEEKDITINYFNELATVTDVWQGAGKLLHPNGDCPMYSFSPETHGYGIRIAWENPPLPKEVTPITAQVLFGL